MQSQTASTIRLLRSSGWTVNEIAARLRLSFAEVEPIAEPVDPRSGERLRNEPIPQHFVRVDTFMHHMIGARRR